MANLKASTVNGVLTLSSISGTGQTVPNSYGAYLHLGTWADGRTATGTVLVNTAYRADYATDLFDMNISRFTNNSGYITANGATGADGNFYIDDNYGYGIVGLYESTRYQGVFAMGNSYKLSADGTSPGSLYGIAWTHTNVGGESKAGLGHQALFMMNGRTYTAIGSGIWTDGTITTTSHGTSANWNTAYGWGSHSGLYLGISAKAADSELLDGLDLHTGRNNEANKVVRTDGNGYIQAGWINTTSGNNGTTAIARIYASDDGYIRYYTPANFRALITDGVYQPLENQRLSTDNAPTFAEVYNNGWFRTTGYDGLYNPTNGAHFHPNDYSYGAWRIIGSRNGWQGLHFGGANGITLMMNEGEFGFHREGVGWVGRFTAGFFDGTAAAANSVAWGNVSGRPSAVSSFTNDSGYITSGGRAYPRRSDGGDLNFYWSGQGGQPTWLWGGTDGVNMYVYNPSNFSVNYASSAGSATTATNQDGGYVSAGTGGIDELYAGNVYANVYYRKDNTGWYMNPGEVSNMNIIYVDRIDNYGYITNSNWNTAGMLYVGEAGDTGAYPIQCNAVRWDLSIYAPNGPIWGNGIVDISDLKLKTNIASIESPIEKIKDLRGVTYQWKHIDDGKTHAGFIAQEVEVVLPDLVSTTIDPETLGEIKGVDYSGVIPYLVESIKLQQAMIEDLQARLALLENNS